MIVDLTLQECTYIAMTTRFFRSALSQESPETLQEIAKDIMMLEETQVGQELMIKLQGLLEQSATGECYHR